MTSRTTTTLIVAVSGGIDSCVLLHKLHFESLIGDIPLAVVHVDHQLRKASDDDAKFVQALCQHYGRPCHIVQIAVQTTGNRQAHARSQRYAVLARLAHQYRTRLVATGHHAHDQHENARLRELMGRFGDLVEFREMPQWDICLWRPLLSMNRPQIHAYAEDHGLEWREDESNTSPRYLRNRVRDLDEEINVQPIAPNRVKEPIRIAAHRWWVEGSSVEDLAEACRLIPGIKLSRPALNLLVQASNTAIIATHGGLVRRFESGFEVIRTTCQGTRSLPAAALTSSEDVRKVAKMEF